MLRGLAVGWSAGPHPGGMLRVWLGGLQAHTPGGRLGGLARGSPGPYLGGAQAHTYGVPRPTPGGGVYPNMHWDRQPPPPQQTGTAAGGMHPTGMHSFVENTECWISWGHQIDLHGKPLSWESRETTFIICKIKYAQIHYGVQNGTISFHWQYPTKSISAQVMRMRLMFSRKRMMRRTVHIRFCFAKFFFVVNLNTKDKLESLLTNLVWFIHNEPNYVS